MENASAQMHENHQIPVRLKLSLLWASLMALYIYNDYFTLFMPGTIEAMSKGSLGPLGDVTEVKMLAVAIVLAIPASMIFLSSALSAGLSRWLNGIFGVIYCIIAVLTFFGAPLFYKFIVSLEIVATLIIIFYALRWPRS